MVLVQTTISDDDFEDLLDFCRRERITRASLMNSLITDFLETTDKERRDSIVEEARKIKPGRKGGEFF